jgi:riboflavin biosynthesis pyrimidine reductase
VSPADRLDLDRRQNRTDEVSDDITGLVERYLTDVRRHDDGRPWLVLNMITSLDGAIAIEGRSGGLGSAADKEVFRALRSLADVILVAAGTVRAEGYRAPKLSDTAMRERRDRGQSELPAIAVVTRSLDLDTGTELFSTPGYRPTVVTVSDAPAERRARVEEVADVVEAGEGDVDLARAIERLADTHGPLLLVEGGPGLNGQLIAAGLIDELCLTVSPVLIGDPAGGLLGGRRLDRPGWFEIDRVVGADGLVFYRCLRSGDR